MFVRSFALVVGALLGPVVAAADVLAPTRTALEAARTHSPVSDDLDKRAARHLLAGRVDDAHALIQDLRDEVLAARVLFAAQDIDGVRSLVSGWGAAPADPDRREILYRWLFTTDDLARVDELSGAGEHAVDRIAAGRLALAQHDRDLAEEHFAAARDASDGARRAAALRGLSSVEFKRRDFDASFERLTEALPLDPLDGDLLLALGGTLIRLGRTDEAIEACELAVDIEPNHEGAHYMLGNGYARKTYTQLYEAYPESFADEDGVEALAQGDEHLAKGDMDRAEEAYRKVAGEHPGWADPPVRLGSLAFARGDFAAARQWFEAALDICPEYGRAHNGLAKALEGERLGVEVHRAAYEEAFAAERMPRVEGIEEFVLNWDALSERHQKRVALSVEPWARYIPVLVEGGYTYYIKPLHELLSETPGQHRLRDLRISYDSRLWDDVRGCGGYHTVTGIEDVERNVFNRYNTVLHEMTHQVHAVFPAEVSREIQELYRETKERDEASDEDAFLSRYAGGSVWEYFAEGANALESPARDEYDAREMVRERLEEKDPALRDLVVRLMEEQDLEPCYPVAYTGRGDQDLQENRVDEAVKSYEKALDYTPDEEGALGSLVYASLAAGRPDEALDWSDKAVSRQPRSGSLASRRANALRYGAKGVEEAVRFLSSRRGMTRKEDRHLVDAELGRLHWIAGDAEASLEAYGRVLEYQSDDPGGLWGTASAHALAGDWDAAWESYESAVRVRTGVVSLRASYALDLLRAGEWDRAKEQIDAGLLLDEGDPDLRALDAWWMLETGEVTGAVERASAALADAPWCDWARVLAARARAAAGDEAAARATLAPLAAMVDGDAPPVLVYRDDWGRFEEAHTLSAVLRAEVDALR